MTDSTGQVVWAADYKPFGEATVTVSTITNNLRFPGQYFDAETGNHYNYFRDYDPVIGKYKQADPIGLKGGINPFVYVGNNSVNWKDPLGLSHLYYDPNQGTLLIFPERVPLSPEPIEFPAANNTIRPNANPYQPEGNGPAPYGTFPMGAFIPHDDGPNSAYGLGSFPIILPLQVPFLEPRVGPALHGGRRDRCDKRGRCGVQHATRGCIRTTDEAIRLLMFDPPRTITIQPSVSF